MKRKIFFIGFIFLLFINLLGSLEVGYELLNRMTVSLDEMEDCDEPEKREKIIKSMNEMKKDAREAIIKSQIDKTFYKRFSRLLSLQKLILVNDPEGILGSLIQKEITEFLKDIKGENFNQKDQGDFFTLFRETMVEEISALRDYLKSKAR